MPQAFRDLFPTHTHTQANTETHSVLKKQHCCTPGPLGRRGGLMRSERGEVTQREIETPAETLHRNPGSCPPHSQSAAPPLHSLTLPLLKGHHVS